MDCEKIAKTVIEKVFFLFFYTLSVFPVVSYCVQKFEKWPVLEVNICLQIGQIGLKKLRILCLFENVRGGFVSEVHSHFLNQHQIFNFLIPKMTYFKMRNFHLSEGPFLSFLTQQPI